MNMTFLSYPKLRSLSTDTTLNNQKFSIIDLIVLSSYYLFCLFLVLGLTGLFQKEFIVLGLVPGFLFFLFFRPLKLSFNGPMVFFILIPVLFAGILFIKGAFNGDGIDYWLPWAREIVLQARMPDFLFDTTAWFASRAPLMPLFYAGIFSFLGFHDWAAAILPFFFSAATVFLLYQWLQEKGIRKSYIIFGPLLLLANPLFLHLGGEVAQEPFILFFFTAFFYYLEKYQRTHSHFHFLLLLISVILSAVTKESGIILFLPMSWLIISKIKNKQLSRPYFYLFLTFPLLIWLVRNYIIYDNPVSPLFNEIFKGRYYDIILISSRIFQNFTPPFWDNILARLTEVPVSVFLLSFPLGPLSFYGFYKKRKIQYIFLSFIFLLTILLAIANFEYVRYFMPFLIVLIVYALAGLEEIKSRIFLSFIFLINLWGLLYTKLPLPSQSQFFSSAEGYLNNFRDMAQFSYDYRLFLALALSVFFFFLISHRQETAKYLILLIGSAYLVKTVSFDLGSWLNIWLPILGLIFIVIIWPLLTKLKEETVRKSVIVCIIILLALDVWGLPGAYFLTHGKLVFPNVKEAYGAQPEAAKEIEKLEGENKDFYIYAASSAYFSWYHNLKTVISRDSAFHVITNLEWKEDLSPSEIHGLFKRSGIKYVMDNIYRPPLKPFFDKIKNRPDLFSPIFQKEGITLWQVI